MKDKGWTKCEEIGSVLCQKHIPHSFNRYLSGVEICMSSQRCGRWRWRQRVATSPSPSVYIYVMSSNKRRWKQKIYIIAQHFRLLSRHKAWHVKFTTNKRTDTSSQSLCIDPIQQQLAIRRQHFVCSGLILPPLGVEWVNFIFFS